MDAEIRPGSATLKAKPVETPPPTHRQAIANAQQVPLRVRRPVLFWTLVLTVVFEMLAVVLRYGFGLEATRDSASTVGSITFGVRIHHGYIGVVLVLVAWLCCRRATRRFQVLLSLGLALVISDLVHHFLVLWPIEGDPHFDLVYPAGR